MRVFKVRWFARFARKEGIGDDVLVAAVRRAERGLIDADIGGGLIKLRIARQGKGRSGGYRTLLVYREARLAVFLYGFAKSERENIEVAERDALQEIAAGWLNSAPSDWDRQVKQALVSEIGYDDES